MFDLSPDGNMHASTHSMAPDGSDKFFTIDESYCPTVQHHPLIFDDVIRKTIYYYVENVTISNREKRFVLFFIPRMNFKSQFIYYWHFIQNWVKIKYSNYLMRLIINGLECILV
jgi:hypothetical protein